MIGAVGPRRKDPAAQRVYWLATLLALCSVAIAARLVDLQVIRREEFADKARRQQERTVEVNARRGRILDRMGRPLAESIEVPSLYADSTAVDNPARVAERLAPLLGRDRSDLAAALDSGRSFVWLARRVAPTVAEAAKSQGFSGVDFVTESRRYYPGGWLAAHVLGFVGMDGDGLAGVEYRYNDVVRGQAGRMMAVQDARGTRVLRYLKRPFSSGEDVHLTLDAVIQYHAELELDRAMDDTGAEWGSVIVMDPSTGAVLAMANRPSFNPNAFAKATPDARRNRSVNHAYEPGSTFKVVVAAAALERGLVDPSEVIDCGRGFITVAGTRIRDHKVFDRLAFADVISESSNVGAIRVGLRIAPEEFRAVTVAFGFGTRTGVGLPGEYDGVVHPVERWSGVTQASMSMGQELTATPLQVLRAIAAVANGGLLPQPYIVERPGGPREPARRVISAATAAVLTTLLERTVSQGTGKLAGLPGYRVAGKTGTAQKAWTDRAGYSDEHIPSFVGYVPSRRPALAMIVVLDAPKGKEYHGGDVAAPVFARVALPVLRYLRVPPDEGGLSMPSATTMPALRKPARARPLLRTVGGIPVVPDLSGESLRDALALLARSGLTARVQGTGRVVRQEPTAGEVLPEGGVVRVLLSSGPLVPQTAGERRAALGSGAARR